MQKLSESQSPSLEEWRPIPGWEDLYEVSSEGKIKSLSRTVKVPGRKTYIRPERLMSLQTDRYGHQYVDLTRNAQHLRRQVHQLVAEAWHGPKPKGHGALHKNGIHTDNRPENLYWGDQKSNHNDAVRHNSHSRDRRGQFAQAHSSSA